jgi:hypothetical protein
LVLTYRCFAFCDGGNCDLGALLCFVPLPIGVAISVGFVVVVVIRTFVARMNPARLALLVPLFLLGIWGYGWLRAELAF